MIIHDLGPPLFRSPRRTPPILLTALTSERVPRHRRAKEKKIMPGSWSHTTPPQRAVAPTPEAFDGEIVRTPQRFHGKKTIKNTWVPCRFHGKGP